VARWVGWVWPFAALGWLLVEVGRLQARRNKRASTRQDAG
jgi:polyferredoxin